MERKERKESPKFSPKLNMHALGWIREELRKGGITQDYLGEKFVEKFEISKGSSPLSSWLSPAKRHNLKLTAWNIDRLNVFVSDILPDAMKKAGIPVVEAASIVSTLLHAPLCEPDFDRGFAYLHDSAAFRVAPVVEGYFKRQSHACRRISQLSDLRHQDNIDNPDILLSAFKSKLSRYRQKTYTGGHYVLNKDGVVTCSFIPNPTRHKKLNWLRNAKPVDKQGEKRLYIQKTVGRDVPTHYVSNVIRAIDRDNPDQESQFSDEQDNGAPILVFAHNVLQGLAKPSSIGLVDFVVDVGNSDLSRWVDWMSRSISMQLSRFYDQVGISILDRHLKFVDVSSNFCGIFRGDVDHTKKMDDEIASRLVARYSLRDDVLLGVPALCHFLSENYSVTMDFSSEVDLVAMSLRGYAEGFVIYVAGLRSLSRSVG